MQPITIKGVTFEYCSEWNLYLKKNDIITPIFKHGKIIMLLITERKTGRAFYVNANTRAIYIRTHVSVIYTPHGTTYLLHENIHVSVLNTWITINSIKNEQMKARIAKKIIKQVTPKEINLKSSVYWFRYNKSYIYTQRLYRKLIKKRRKERKIIWEDEELNKLIDEIIDEFSFE